MMKINRIERNNREIIKKFLTSNGMEGIIDYCDFKLIDKSPTKDYFSYYVECEGRFFGIIIDYENKNICIHKNYKVKLSMKF